MRRCSVLMIAVAYDSSYYRARGGDKGGIVTCLHAKEIMKVFSSHVQAAEVCVQVEGEK